jgi:preprotein translocase subunit YajC
MKQMKDMMANVKRGDTVVTAGGIIGKVTKPPQQDDPEITVEIADNVQVRVLKSTLTEVRAKNAPADAKSAKS